METIVVEPSPSGWSVRTDAIENPMVFRSGSAAEDTAKGLALKLARTGELVRLKLRLRNSVEARFICLPPLDTGGSPQLVQLPDP